MTRPASLGASCLLLAACVSADTSQRLDRGYAATATLLSKHRERSPNGPVAELGGAIDRDTIVALAVAQSPALTAMARRARAMLRGAQAEGSLPSPELGLEAWNLPLTRPYAVGDADMYMVELRQRFPAAGSLDARARAAAEDAAAMLAEVASEERAVAQRAADAYADYLRAYR